MTGLDPNRVAEILVTGPPGAADGRASGYRVKDGVVLTAEHAVRDRTGITVRFNADQPDEWTAPASIIWSDSTEDGALLLLRPQPGAPRVAPAGWGRLGDRPGVLEAQAVGFPWWKLRQAANSQGPSRYRDMHQAICTISSLSNRRSHTLELTTSPPASRPDPQRSPWEGMSGAAVWVNGRIVGVVRAHTLAEGPNHLTASRIDRLIRAMPAEIKAVAGISEPLIDVLDPTPAATPTRDVGADHTGTGRNAAIAVAAWFAGQRRPRRPADTGHDTDTDDPNHDPLALPDGDGSLLDFDW